MTHRHTWQESGEAWACTECAETSATCIVGKPHPTGTSLLICDDCLKAERRVLDDIETAFRHWSYGAPSTVPAVRYDRELAHGDTCGERSDPVEIAAARDVADVLWSWVGMWSESAGVDNASAPDYLRSRLLWAARNPAESAWGDYRREVRALRYRARLAAGLLPRRHSTPCVHCGGDVVQDWAERDWSPRGDGLSDVLRCTGCGMEWGNHGRWTFVTRHHLRALPLVNPDALVTLEDARMIWPDIPAATVRSWMQRDREAEAAGGERLVPERSCDVRGAPTYRVGDLAELVARRDDTTRRGRQVTAERSG